MTRTVLSLAALLAAALLTSTVAAAQEEADWRPLDPDRFAEELTEPWIPVPDGESGAPRQGWLNTTDGFFTREVHLAYDWSDDRPDGDLERGIARFHYPLSRRLWVGIEAPFVQSLDGESGFGNVTATGQVMLAETRNFSLNAGAGVELDTADDDFQGGFGVVPQVNFWRDVGAGVSVRGRLAYALRDDEGQDGLIANFAAGQTVTPPENAPFGQFTYYLSANLFEPENGDTFFSLTPGIRTRLVGNLFFLAGVEFPLTDRDDSFDHRLIGQFVWGF